MDDLLSDAARRWKPLAAAAVLLVALGIWWTQRAATVSVVSSPAGEVLLDGEPMGQTPRRFDASPGKHELTLRSGGFLDSVRTIELGAGEKRTLEFLLVADGAANPVALDKLAKRLRVVVAKLDRASAQRGDGDRPKVQAVFPRGFVRAEDLDTVRIDVGPDFEPGAPLQFYVGPTRVHQQPFDPKKPTTILKIPDELKGQAVVRWGVKPSFVTYRVVSVPEIEKRLAEPLLVRQPAPLAAVLKASILLAGEFHYGAYRALAGVEPTEHTCAGMQAALRGMKLTGSRAWDDLAKRVAALK
jgi:hypothetical protein